MQFDANGTDDFVQHACSASDHTSALIILAKWIVIAIVL